MLGMKKAADFQHFMVEENRSHSECCSGSQSGWTLYLHHSLSHPTPLSASFQLKPEHPSESEQEEEEKEEEEEEEEDLSMLSDASSGPPHIHCSCFCESGDGCLCNGAFLPLKRRKAAEEQINEQNSFLDDTASSTLFTIYKTPASSGNKVSTEEDHSSCFSATHFKVCRQGGGKRNCSGEKQRRSV